MLKSFLLVTGLCASCALMAAPDFPDSVDTLAFGSCAKEQEAQPVWEKIAAHQPDLFLFLGDNQYADLHPEDNNGEDEWVSRPVTEVARIKEAYDTLANRPHFKRFREQVPVMGIWDDHDYGANDAGKDYPLKKQSQQQFLDFFGFADDDPIRQQEGIYHSRMFGRPGKRLQLILLDTRYHRDDLVLGSEGEWGGKGPYVPAQDNRDVLGEAQWRWLEAQLRKPAQLRIIASSIQVVAYEHGWESWGNFPVARQRLFTLIDQTGAEGVLFLSGDRHLMELSVASAETGEITPYPFWDFTASGLNQGDEDINEPNRFREGPVYRTTNYGVLNIDWLGKHLSLHGYDGEGRRLLTKRIAFEELR